MAELNAYELGLILGTNTRKLREAGLNPDVRPTLAQEARRLSSESFNEFLRGVNDGVSASEDEG